jgi:PTS system ascorbate-specific IIA component
MVGVLLITHGGTGAALLAAAEHVLGVAQANAAAIAVAPADDRAAVLAHARRQIAALDTGDGVIVLTDVYGATPSNIAAGLLEPGRVEGIAGVNLPMLVKALGSRAMLLPQVLAQSLAAGARGLVNMKEDACHAAAGGS